MNTLNFLFNVLVISGVTGHTQKATDDESCALENGSFGTCVRLSACDSYSTLLKDGSTITEGLRLVNKNTCGMHEQESKVCCPVETKFDAVTLKPITKISLEESKLVLNSRQPKLDPENFVTGFLEPFACGKDLNRGERSRDCSFKYNPEDLLNGKPAYPGISFWMALLGYQGPEGIAWQCGGTIITKKHVLTAAHCIKRNLYLVRVGEIDLNFKGMYDGRPADYLIKKSIRHENYYKYHNDIAILVVEKEMEFNDFVNAICLPVANTSYTKIQVEVEDFVTDSKYMIQGWGLIENGTKPTQLQYTHVNNLDKQVCRDLYKRYNVTIDERVLCAGADKADACSGDSGGPLLERYCTSGLVKDLDYFRDIYYQRAIVSYGFRCSDSRFAGVYTNIEHFMPWIKEKIVWDPSREEKIPTE